MKRRVSIYTTDGNCHQFIMTMSVTELATFRRFVSLNNTLEIVSRKQDHWEIFNRPNIVKVLIAPSNKEEEDGTIYEHVAPGT